MQLDIITPEKTLYSADATMVVIPGALGDFGVLDGHMPFISVIRPGVIIIDTPSGQRKLGVLGGIAEVVPTRCTVLAEVAVDCGAETPSSLQATLQQARAELDAAINDAQKKEADKKIALAEAILTSL